MRHRSQALLLQRCVHHGEVHSCPAHDGALQQISVSSGPDGMALTAPAGIPLNEFDTPS